MDDSDKNSRRYLFHSYPATSLTVSGALNLSTFQPFNL
jgi:hypothetical protein